MTRSLFTAAFAALFAALVPFAVQAQTSPTPSYVDVSGYALPDAQFEAWINLRIDLLRSTRSAWRDQVERYGSSIPRPARIWRSSASMQSASRSSWWSQPSRCSTPCTVRCA